MTLSFTRPQPADLLVSKEQCPSNLRSIGDMQWQQRIARAVAKARTMRQKAWRLDVTTERQGEQVPVYTVRSNSHQTVWYIIYVFEAGIQCSCEAGRRWMPCCHAARVALRLCREYRPLRVTDLPSSPFELFEEPMVDDSDNVERTLNIPDLIEWDILPSICTSCGVDGEPGAVVCAVCGVVAGESFLDREPLEIYEFV